LVNNAGILKDRTVWNMTDAEQDGAITLVYMPLRIADLPDLAKVS
jgi:hypothetical protein